MMNDDYNASRPQRAVATANNNDNGNNQEATKATAATKAMKANKKEKSKTNRPSIRHVEKRRTSTCHFSDRIAQVSIDLYRKIVPNKHQGASTCLATIVAYFEKSDSFCILGLVRVHYCPCLCMTRGAERCSY